MHLERLLLITEKKALERVTWIPASDQSMFAHLDLKLFTRDFGPHRKPQITGTPEGDTSPDAQKGNIS